MKKIARHEAWSMKKPPTNGPTIIVIDVNADQVPIALPRSLSGNVALMMARLPGTMRAAPMPCSARNAISIRMLGASPQAIEPAVNTATPMRKMRLRPSRSPSAPPVSMSAARKSVYASTTHCTSAIVAPMVACSTGSAMFTTLPSMNAMLEPRMVAVRTQRLLKSLIAYLRTNDRSALQPIPRPEDPRHDGEAHTEESRGEREAEHHRNIGDSVEAPAESVDEVHDGIEQAEGAPG